MENENVVFCPVHKEPLKLEIIKFKDMGEVSDIAIGRCLKCQTGYIGIQEKDVPEFIVGEKQYRFLDAVRRWKIQKEAEDERKIRRKKIPFLKSRTTIIKFLLNENKICQSHKNEMIPMTIMLRKNAKTWIVGNYCTQCNAIYLDTRFENQIWEYICFYENEIPNLTVAVFSEMFEKPENIMISKIYFVGGKILILEGEKVLEEEIERLNREIERKKIERQQAEAEIEQFKVEQTRKKFEEERFKIYPFLRLGKIKIETVCHNPSHCPVHKQCLGMLQCKFKEKHTIDELEIGGFYCPKCNCIYLKKRVEKRIKLYSHQIEESRAEYELIPLGRTFRMAPPLEVSELKLLDSNNDKDNYSETIVAKCEPQYMNAEVEKSDSFDEKFFKIMAYQKFDREVAEILATIDGQETFIRILTSVKDIDKYKCVQNELLIRESESTGRELLGRIAHDQLGEFSSKYGTIKIHNYKVWPGQEHHLDGFTRFCDPENIQNITIMSQNNLSRDSDEYEMVTALVYCANRVEPVYIDVYYSKRQNKYFINEESYRQYRVRYGLPYVHLVADEYDGDMDYGNLRKNSELNLYGYTVAKTAEMSTGERQRLLQQLMDNGLMSKHQIVNHLEWLIHRQSGRIKMEDACDCWREDLRFVNNYRLNAQRKIQGRFVYGKTVLR